MCAKSAEIATVCECIDHCFAFTIWCDDFARFIDAEDMVAGLDRGFDLMSDATRLQSFLALRKLDDFLGSTRPKPDDLVAENFGIDAASILDTESGAFLSASERTDINKGAAHLTERLTLEPDTEVDLQEIVLRSLPVFSGLVEKLRALDETSEAAHWLDRTDALIGRIRSLMEG